MRAAVAFFVVCASVSAAAQLPKPLGPTDTIPKGQQIEAKDGDTVLVRGGARVRMVHRSQANVRAIYNSAERWVVLLADYSEGPGAAPDGFVDSTYSFHEVDGVWPLGLRWEGLAVIDEYTMPYTAGGSYGLIVDGAFVQIFSGSPASNNRWFADARAVQLHSRGGGRTNEMPGARGLTFDQAEERAIAEASRNAQRGDRPMTTTVEGPGGTTLTSRVGMRAPSVVTGTPKSDDAPVRVGSNIATPRKTVDAAPVTPPAAQQAGVRGVVILEIAVGADGTVTNAKVLRSIPLLDQAALDAVKQWRYEPTLLNGRPVPVIMTVTVAFP